MEQMVNSINNLCQKSINEDHALTDIKGFIGYKYPVCPSNDGQGRSIYSKCFSKLDTHWQYNELEEMKERSVFKRRANSKLRQDNFKVQNDVSPAVKRLDTLDETKKTPRSPTKDHLDLVSLKTDRQDFGFSATRRSLNRSPRNKNNFDLFKKDGAGLRLEESPRRHRARTQVNDS